METLVDYVKNAQQNANNYINDTVPPGTLSGMFLDLTTETDKFRSYLVGTTDAYHVVGVASWLAHCCLSWQHQPSVRRWL
jgi:hypothetical protein